MNYRCLMLVVGLVLVPHETCSIFYFSQHKTAAWHLDPAFIAQLVSEFRPDFFLETGTCSGMTARAAAPFFKQVHTVELGLTVYQEAQKNLASIPQVTLYLDHSAAMIKKVAPTLNGHILFWLDAHYSGGNTVRSNDDLSDPNSDTPIRQELQAIKKCNIRDCTILIDDIRGFGSTVNGTNYCGWWAYPSIQELCNLGREINPDFEFALLGDMLLMYDHTRFSPQFSPVVHACTASRLYDGDNLSDAELLQQEEVIMNSQGCERDFITYLYRWEQEAHIPLLQHHFWYGLIAMGSNNWTEASRTFEKIEKGIELIHKKNEPSSKQMLHRYWRINHYKTEIKRQSSRPLLYDSDGKKP